LAAGGISIPVVVHLWNIRQGKILKVGSIRLLARTAQQRARSLQITEWVLLLLRCLLIILLALLLARPYWKTSAQKGWILMEKSDAVQAYAHFKPLVDSLLHAGYTFHLFEKGFAETELSTVLNNKKDTGMIDRSSYWQLIRLLDKQSLPGMPVQLFTGNRLNRFTGERPDIGISVTWNTFTHTDSIQRFISDAYLGNNDSIILSIIETRPFSTSSHQQVIAANQPRQNDFVLNVNNGNLSVSIGNGEPVPVDTTKLKITLFANLYSNDLRYVQAAIQSIKQVKKKRIDLTVTRTPAQLPAKQDWLFWLSDLPVPANVDAHSVFVYQPGKIVQLQSNILINAFGTDMESALYQRIGYAKTNAAILWKDATGSPLLTKENDHVQQRYHFYSHFDPSWNDLPWSPFFPQMIYGLMDTGSKDRIEANDRRVIDETQLKLLQANTAKIEAPAGNVDNTNAKHILWIMIFVIFCIERFFSYRIKKETAYA
jgi:hypothetical protein